MSAQPQGEEMTAKSNTDPSTVLTPRQWTEEWWAINEGKVRRCKAHRHNGNRCKRAACVGGVVCDHHGGRAAQVQRKARQRLEEASDRLARQLLNMTTDPNVADPVKLAAIKDALDRGGLGTKSAVSVEVSAKPYELVFDRIMAGPRTEHTPALEIGDGSLEDGTDKLAAESEER